MLKEDNNKGELLNSYFASIFFQKANEPSCIVSLVWDREWTLAPNKQKANELKSVGSDELHPKGIELADACRTTWAFATFEKSWRTGNVPGLEETNIILIF